jgi:SAM-dependent methyltransferase
MLEPQILTDEKRLTEIAEYEKNGRKPWSRGYLAAKFAFIEKCLADPVVMEGFRADKPLPDGFGHGYDERVVEYPWVLSRLNRGGGRLLDAGSCFNYPEIVGRSEVADKDFSIFTLAPEANCFWEKGISYLYGDLRDMPFRDDWFDEVISISTLGHVGMDNRLYTNTVEDGKVGLEAEQAVGELVRILKPGGKLYVSVVYGVHQLIEWSDGSVFAEQFDETLLADLVKAFGGCSEVGVTIYGYTQKGWNVSTLKDHAEVEYYNIHVAHGFDADNAAAARAVAFIEARK